VHTLLALGVLVALAAQPAPALHRFEAVEPHMGTLVRITVYTLDEQAARRALDAAFARIRELDGILSDYKPDSELRRITAGAAAGAPVRVSRDLFAVLRASQDLAEASNGAFDVTLGPIVQLWRAARSTGRVPDAAALQEAAQRSGYRRLHLDVDNQTVTLQAAGMSLDLGGIGKGYAASEALEVLRALGAGSALVAVSGDLAFGDAPPGRPGWAIRVLPAGTEAPGIPEVLELTNGAVSTSGMGAQHVEVDGRRYSHIVDPLSGLGLVDDVTVTVMARHGVTADGLATAVSVLGSDRGLVLIESRPDAAALVVRHGGARAAFLTSSRFPAVVTPALPPASNAWPGH
jgi:FAD:protein FMN transferase